MASGTVNLENIKDLLSAAISARLSKGSSAWHPESTQANELLDSLKQNSRLGPEDLRAAIAFIIGGIDPENTRRLEAIPYDSHGYFKDANGLGRYAPTLGHRLRTELYDALAMMVSDLQSLTTCQNGTCIQVCSGSCSTTCTITCATSCKASTCTGGCYTGCAGSCVQNSCSNVCSTSTCTGGCNRTCSATCTLDCVGGCTNRCDGCTSCDGCSGCTSCTSCSGSCDGSCSGSCDGGCSGGCGSSCRSGCTMRDA